MAVDRGRLEGEEMEDLASAAAIYGNAFFLALPVYFTAGFFEIVFFFFSEVGGSYRAIVIIILIKN